MALAGAVLWAIALTGCLLTMGAPLVRRVEPDRWVLESGGGATLAGPTAPGASPVFGTTGYAYFGRALGKHFEIGLLPVISSLGSGAEAQWSITAPLKWDPFPHDWPTHLIVFAGPSVIVAGGTYGAVVTGAGVSWKVTDRFEGYGSFSAPLPSWQFLTASVGARLAVNPLFQLGAGVSYTYPGLFTATAGATVLSKPR